MWIKGEARHIINEERGRIIPVADGDFKTVMIIESKKGAIRANHFHRSDSHIMHIVSGCMRYVEEHHGFLEEKTLRAGDSVLTLPGIPHAAEFLEDTVMVVAAKNARDTATYMADITPCKLI